MKHVYKDVITPFGGIVPRYVSIKGVDIIKIITGKKLEKLLNLLD